ncbi:MAG: hypothetical protein MUF80_07080, partial [Burkholderiales bacterium]|nr:hypothetical protein [Burkholderiales bacterium]
MHRESLYEVSGVDGAEMIKEQERIEPVDLLASDQAIQANTRALDGRLGKDLADDGAERGHGGTLLAGIEILLWLNARRPPVSRVASTVGIGQNAYIG